MTAEDSSPDDYFDPPPPPVWPWFLGYCWFMVVFEVLCVIIGIAVCFMDPAWFVAGMAPAERESVLKLMRIGGIVTILTSLPFVAAYLAGIYLPRNRWTWFLDLFLIVMCVSMCVPIGIIFLIFWLNPETKAYFGMQPPIELPPPHP